MKSIVAQGTLAYSLYDYLNNNLSGSQSRAMEKDLSTRLDSEQSIEKTEKLYEALDEASQEIDRIYAELKKEQ
ncbi:MAG: hypothetical protein AWU57_3747 [Marinobacter sp. T13-3]|nr:MAG: hypothetical protein AWU57_3747 [Marinobacter sp. T13-3]